MTSSSNYLKIKNRRLLRRQIRDSKQLIQTAGSNDADNMPGSVSGSSNTENSTGVPMPNSYYNTEVFYGDSLSLHSAGSGVGSVGMPPEQPREPINSDGIGPRAKIASTIRDSLRPRNADLPGSQIQAGSNIQNPLGNSYAGEMSEELDRTTSLDGYRNERFRNRDRKRARRRFY